MGKIIAIATPVFFALIALEYLLGRARGRSNYRLNDAVNSLSLGVMSQVVGLFTKLLVVGIYAAVYSVAALWQLPAEQWWVWVLAIVSYDFCYYWNHRLGHESAVFWAAHVVHHQSQEYNLSTALRQTSSGALLGWIFYLPMAIAGIPPEVFVVAAVVNLLYQYWIHTEQVGSARLVRPLVRLAVESPRAPRSERPLHRPQLRRHHHALGPPVRHVRRGGRALRVRHARPARLVGPAVGELRGVRRPRPQVARPAPLARQAGRVADAARLAAGTRGWPGLAQACAST